MDNMKTFWLALLLVITVSCRKDIHVCDVDSGHSGLQCKLESITLDALSTISLPRDVSDEDVKVVKIEKSHLDRFPTKQFYEKFDNLIEIDINDCTGLKRLENSFLHVNLIDIDVKNSDLEEVGEIALSKLRRLVQLKLNRNRIKIIHKNAFNDLAKVERIEMDSNQISWLHDDTFAYCTQLKFLKLSNNKIVSITSKLFSRNVELNEIHLASNEICGIEKGFLTKLRILKKLDLIGNSCASINLLIPQSAYIAILSQKLSRCYEGFEVIRSGNETVDKIHDYYDKHLSEIMKSVESRANETIKNLTEHLSNFDVSPNFIHAVQKFDDVDMARDTEINVHAEASMTAARRSHGEDEVTIYDNLQNELSKCWIITITTCLTTLFIFVAIVVIAHRRVIKKLQRTSPVTLSSLESNV